MQPHGFQPMGILDAGGRQQAGARQCVFVHQGALLGAQGGTLARQCVLQRRHGHVHGDAGCDQGVNFGLRPAQQACDLGAHQHAQHGVMGAVVVDLMAGVLDQQEQQRIGGLFGSFPEVLGCVFQALQPARCGFGIPQDHADGAHLQLEHLGQGARLGRRGRGSLGVKACLGNVLERRVFQHQALDGLAHPAMKGAGLVVGDEELLVLQRLELVRVVQQGSAGQQQQAVAVVQAERQAFAKAQVFCGQRNQCHGGTSVEKRSLGKYRVFGCRTGKLE
jgi:hypothetical protein